jgi:serralysin
MITGRADPGATIRLRDLQTPNANLATVTSTADGSWFVGLSFFHGEPLSPGRHDLVAIVLPSGPAGPSSAVTRVDVGTSAADAMNGPVLGVSVDGPDYIFAGPGDDVIAAFTLSPDALGDQASRAFVAIDGGRERNGGGGFDQVQVPLRLADVQEHLWQPSPIGGPAALQLRTEHVTLLLQQVESLRFLDVTITVRMDPLVDFLFYDQTYADMAEADTNARAHYDAYGWREGRDPNAHFSTLGYLSAYGDVRMAGLNPLNHYDATGWREGRDPSATFDTSLYLRFNPDVAAVGLDPLQHYLTHGRAEGRQVFSVVASDLVSSGFDPLYYKLANPDIGLAALDPALHFEQSGWREGRNPNSWFDTDFYRSSNPDVASARIDPLAHYIDFGWREGRDPSPRFDTDAYLARYDDVAVAGINPLQHFLQYGVVEGRLASGDLI